MMENDKDIEKAMDAYNREIRKDHIEVEIEKNKFVREIKGGLGERLIDYRSYIKREPSAFQKIKTKIKRFFRYI